MTQPQRPALTSTEMGAAWHVSPDTAVRWARQGRADAEQTPGGHWRFYGPLPATYPHVTTSASDGTEDPTDAR
jgi:hypothetical protein